MIQSIAFSTRETADESISEPCVADVRAALVVVLSSASTQAADWARFRGPDGQGISPDKGLPVTWSETENVLWKTELPGAGTSSPIVVGTRST